MNAYRSYMDRITAPPGLHARLLDALGTAAPRRRPARALRWGALAACCALAALGGWGLLSGAPGAGGPLPVGEASPPAALTPAPTPDPTPVPTPEEGFALVVTDPFQGMPHSDFSLPALEFPRYDPAGGMEIDWAPPLNQTVCELGEEEIVRILGGADQVPWTLGWAGYSVGGTALFDGEGSLFWVHLAGKLPVPGVDFTLELAPGRLPPPSKRFEGVEPVEYNGVPVTVCFTTLTDGTHRYYAQFMSWDTGVYFQCDTRDPELAEELVAHLVGEGAAATGGGFDIGWLEMEGLQVVSSRRELTLEEARSDALGAWLPDMLPGGFVFEGAFRSQDAYSDLLSAAWTHGYDYINIRVNREGAGNLPSDPGLAPDRITPETLEALGRYVDDDAGDVPGWRFTFTVDFDGALVDYSLKGLTPEQAAALVNPPGA